VELTWEKVDDDVNVFCQHLCFCGVLECMLCALRTTRHRLPEA